MNYYQRFIRIISIVKQKLKLLLLYNYKSKNQISLQKETYNKPINSIDKIHEDMINISNRILKSSDKNFTYIFTEGASSTNGPLTDAMEGMSRVLPLLASLSLSKRTSEINQKILIKIIKNALLNGTKSNIYGWGKAKNLDQKMVEASDIALSLWIMRNTIWINLKLKEQEQVVSWLKQFLYLKVHNNNWLLFKLQINAVLSVITKNHSTIKEIKMDYTMLDVIESWHVGGGWFRDGEKGAIDYYTAWGFCYSFFWLSLIDKNLIRLRRYITLLNENYIYLFSKKGLPLFGRSVCYKQAVLVPIISEAICNDAKKINFNTFDTILNSFGDINNISLQGFMTKNLKLLDLYSGPNSCLWALRPFIQLIYLDNQDSSFITRLSNEPFPSELNNFEVNPNKYLKIMGDKQSGRVTINNKEAFDHQEVNNTSALKRLVKKILSIPDRQKDHPYFSSTTFNSTNEILK